MPGAWIRNIERDAGENTPGLLCDEVLEEHPALVDFALSDEIVGAATRYLGQLPVLRRVGLLLSSGVAERKDSMLLHKDPGDLSQVKIFMNINNIGDSNGPFTFLPADASARVVRGLSHKDGRLSRLRRVYRSRSARVLWSYRLREDSGRYRQRDLGRYLSVSTLWQSS